MLLNLLALLGAGGGASAEEDATVDMLLVLLLADADAAVLPMLLPCSMFIMFSCRPGYHSTSEYRRNTIYIIV